MKKRSIELLLSLLLVLAACSGTAEAPAENSGSDTSASQESSEYIIPSQTEDTSAKTLSREERHTFAKFMESLAGLSLDKAGSSLEVAGLFANLANNFEFYKAKADVVKDACENYLADVPGLPSKEVLVNNVKALKEFLKMYEEDPESAKGQIKDSGNELKPTLEIEELQGFVNMLLDSANKVQ